MATKRIPQEQKDAMVTDYLAGMSAKAAAKKHGCSKPSCLEALRAHGIEPRSIGNNRSVPTAHRDAIAEAYMKGASASEAVAPFGYSSNFCYIVLREKGLVSRRPAKSETEIQARYEKLSSLYNSGQTGAEAANALGVEQSTCYRALKSLGFNVRPNRTHQLNESYFDSIDTQEKAYWLGFITADGNLHKSGNVLKIWLAAKDRDHLSKFLHAVRSDSPIRDHIREGRPYSSAIVCSKHLVNALKGAGLMPNKSLTVEPWQGSHDLMCHYWRGVLDGDGTIYRMAKKQWGVSLVGSQGIVCGFTAFAAAVCGTKATPFLQGRTWSVLIGGKAMPQKLIAALYKDATVALDRKQSLANELLTPSKNA